jgi:hypothetical protein
MAAIAHLGVGLAAKPPAPEINVGWLILGNYVLDFLWFGFAAVGMEVWPKLGVHGHPAWWEHSLLMAVVWWVLFGLMVFAHWVVDFITHPMTAVVPGDTGLPLALSDSPVCGRHSAHGPSLGRLSVLFAANHVRSARNPKTQDSCDDCRSEHVPSGSEIMGTFRISTGHALRDSSLRGSPDRDLTFFQATKAPLILNSRSATLRVDPAFKTYPCVPLLKAAVIMPASLC